MMKRVGKIAVCLAGGLALNAGLRAESVAPPDNPYAPIVVRNVFDLNPPQKVDAAPVVEANPPPKITLNGIMNVFGHLQALYKVSDSGKPGQPPKDSSYILSEGQGQDDVEVVKINEKDALVTFNNHGTVQELPLSSQSASSAPAATTGNPNIPGFHPIINNGGNPGNPFGGPGNLGGTGANLGGGARPGGNGANNFNGLPTVQPRTTYSAPQPQQPELTPEEQVIAIEANRELTKQQVIQGTMPPLPPTVMTPPDATGTGGAPLVNGDLPQQ
jgi:hypothetical protein